jgi:hypothetical protein
MTEALVTNLPADLIPDTNRAIPAEGPICHSRKNEDAPPERATGCSQ